jgi:hypothetical protein
MDNAMSKSNSAPEETKNAAVFIAAYLSTSKCYLKVMI